MTLGGKRPLIGHCNLDSLGQEGELAQPVGQHVEAELDILEDLLVGLEPGHCPVPGRVTDDRDGLLGRAAHVALVIDLALAVDFHLAPLRKGIHDRRADPVKTAGNLVGVLVEFPARIELGHDDLEGADLLRRMDVDGDSPAVVLHENHVSLQQLHRDGGTRADERLVDRVVHDFEDQLVKAVQARGADVHAGPLPDVLQTLEYLYVVGAIGFVHGKRSRGSP